MGEEVPATSDDLIALPPADDRATYLRNTAVMSVGTIASRATGVVRVAVQAWAMGVSISALADVYNAANITPNIVYELLLGGVLTSVFVPVFVEWINDRGQDEAWAVADRVFTFTVVVLSIAGAVAAILAPQIMRFYTLASDSADRQRQIEVGAFFLRWFMPQMLFYGIGAIAGGLLQAKRRFAPPMFVPVLNNLVVIATFAIYAAMRGSAPASLDDLTTAQAMVLGVGTTLGVVAMTVALWPSLRSMGYRFRVRLDWRHPALIKLAKLSAWTVLYVAANQVAYQLIIVLNGRVGQGALTAYQWAFLLFSLPHAIFVVSITTALITGMSGRWTAKDPTGFRELFSRGARDILVITLPAAAGYIALALPISRMLFEQGQTGAGDAELIASALRGFAVGLPFFSAFQLLTRTFYSMQDARTPSLVNVGVACVNVGVDLWLVVGLDWGIAGMTLGYAASYAAGVALLFVILSRRIGGADGRRIAGVVARTLPAALLAAGAAWLAAELVGGNADHPLAIAQVVAGVTVGVLVFLVLALIVHVREVDDVMRALRSRFRR